jgi:hypothetical protein
MKGSNSITAAIFSAFLKCPTKAHLLAIGESAPSTYFADIEARISSAYKTMARRRLHDETEFAGPLDFGQLWCNSNCATVTGDVDCETAVYDFTRPQRVPVRQRSRETSPSEAFVFCSSPGTSQVFPISFSHVSVHSRYRGRLGHCRIPER